MRAALIYQRATSEAAERIADGLDELARRHHKPADDQDGEGAAGVPVPVD
jgi:hypothetical protein